MDLKRVLEVIEEVRGDYQREEDRALLQKNLDDARWALAGKDACDRIMRNLRARAGVPAVLPVQVKRAR